MPLKVISEVVLIIVCPRVTNISLPRLERRISSEVANFAAILAKECCW
jgi:hypothetical protein